MASDALSSQTIMQGIKRYVVKYNMTSIIMIPKGVSSLFTPPSITSTTVWLDAIEDYDKLEDSNYSACQEFILRHGLDVKIESDSWLEGTLLLSMESTLCAEVESDLKCLPVNQRGAITMLCFIIKPMVIRNQEAWDSLEEYIKTFDIRSFPGENVPTACLKLKAVVTVLGDRLPSNAVCIILEGFARASTKSFASVCDSNIAMRSDRIYASLVAKQTLCSQVTSMLNDLEQKYQQLITAEKWEGVGHIALGSQSLNLILAPPWFGKSDNTVYCQKYTVHEYTRHHQCAGLMVTYPTHAMIMFLIWSLLRDDTPAHPIVDLTYTRSSRHTVNLQPKITSRL